MTRNVFLTVGIALALGATAFGQSPPAAPVAPPSPETPSWQPGGPIFEGDAPANDEPRLWGDAVYLLGWVRGDPLPPLVTTSPAGTARTSAGVLGTQGVNVLVGNGVADAGARSGGRADFGYCFDPAYGLSVEVGLFALAGASTNTFVSSDGSTILARPYLDVTTGNPTSSVVAFPGASSGSVLVSDSGGAFYGWNMDLCQSLQAAPWCRLDALLGYQFLRYDERLGVQETVDTISGPFVAGTIIQSQDAFATRNIFNGIDMGLRAELQQGAWSLDLLGKVAAGPVNRTVDIVGSQTVTVPGSAPVVSSGGLLALSSNSGSNSSHTWTAAPQLGVTLGWQVNCNVRVFTGYSALWLLNVVRPGEQVSLDVNPGLIPGGGGQAAGTPSLPAVTGLTSTVWMQAVSFGLEVKY